MKIYFLIVFFWGIQFAYGQETKDTLTLDVKSLNKSKITISDGKEFYNTEDDTLSIENKNWALKINANRNAFLVVVNNTAGSRAKQQIVIKTDTILKIKDSGIGSTSFKFNGVFQLAIEKLDRENSTVAIYKKLVFKNAVVVSNDSSKSTAGGNTIYHAGYPYYDALFLANEKNDPKTQKTIIAHYAGNDTLRDSEIDSILKNNVYLNDYWTKLKIVRLKNVQQQNGKLPISFSSITSSIGGIDVTNIADGLAKFLVKRTKQELSIAFFDKFNKLIADPNYIDLRTVFPATYQALSIIGDEIYHYEAYIKTLRESFEKDLSTLNTNLPSIIENHPAFFGKHLELAVTLRSGCYIAGQLRDKIHPGDILANYPVEYLDSLNPNWKGAIQSLKLISASLKDTAVNTDSVYWVSSKQIKQLVTDTVAFKIYLGLIYQQATTLDIDQNGNIAPITFQKKSLPDVLIEIAPTYSQLRTFISSFGEKANKLNTLIKQYQKAANDSLGIQQYYNYAKAAIDLLKQASAITEVKVIKKALGGINLLDTLKDYFDVAQTATDLILNISKRSYSAAIVNAVHIYDLIKVNKDIALSTNMLKARAAKKVAKEIKNSGVTLQQTNILLERLDSLIRANGLDSSQKREYLVRLDSLKASIGLFDLKNIETTKLKDTIDVKSSLFKYGSFMAAMVQAKSPDDVESTIEAFALPTGSARIKRETPFNISLNAYVGLYTGYEHIKGVDNTGFKFNSYGVTAPIGIAISRGHSIFFAGTGRGGWGEGKKGWSSSLFLSLIDIGAVTAFRFTDDRTVIKNNNTSDTLLTPQVPAIQLKNIISPGLFLSIGIPKSPLSANFGVQMGPNLRKVTSVNDTSQLDFSDNIYWRYSLSICVDIPVFNLYTKSK
ncbi:MAG: hypothetical protein QM764_14675 [Chitinophagaceae bacterium]